MIERSLAVAIAGATIVGVPERNSGPHIHSREAAGLLIISVLIFILILVRYWHNLNWSAR